MWWRDGALYQIYPRSFADSDGDGVGDLRGIIEHLDHLAWLGIEGLWLNPTFPSPNADWGFDVSDYCGVHPELGTLEDLDELADLLVPLVQHPRALGMELTIYDPALDPDRASAGRLVTLLERVLGPQAG